jgi:hypothetical protein
MLWLAVAFVLGAASAIAFIAFGALDAVFTFLEKL